MSGILHRLGALATGQAWSVRSDTRLPFAGDRFADPAESATATAHLDRPAPTASPVADSHPPRPANQGLARPGVVPRPIVPRTPVSLASPPDLTKRVGPATARPSTEPDAVLPLLAPQATLPRQAEENTRSTAAPSDALPTRPPSPPPTLLPSTGRPAPERQGSPVWRAPSALPPRTAADLVPAQAPQGGETEVHIHIGRIEVTALQEAPRPKAKPRDRAQPMSLDAYLDQRRKAS